jgi:hypothetical protein
MMNFVILDEEGFVLHSGVSNMPPLNAVLLDAPLAMPAMAPGFRLKYDTMEVVDCRPDEMVWSEVRARRAALLAQCDWCVMPDSPLPEQQVLRWREYRQALRDITLQADPRQITWPVAPSN